MIKAIIADDEMRVCQLIEHLVDWQSLNISVIGIVNTGIDAFQMIIKEKPQIVITDIRMPGYDGIELIRRTREAGIDTSFIIVSGHRHFEYARTALQYGAQDYILKPIKREELVAALTKAVAGCQSTAEVTQSIENMKERLAVGRQHLRRRLITDLLDNKLVQGVGGYNLEFVGMTTAFALRISQHGDQMVDRAAKEKVIEYLDMELSKWATEWAAAPYDGFSAGLFALPANTENAPRVKELFDGCETQLRPYGNYSITMGTSSCADGAEPGKLLREAVTAVRQHFLQESGSIIPYETGFDYGCDYHIVFDDILQTRFVNAVQLLDIDSADAVLGRFFFTLNQHEHVTADTVSHALQRMADLLNNVIGSFSPEDKKYLDKKVMHKVLEDADSLNEVEQGVKTVMLSHLEGIAENRKRMENRPVRLAKQYIAEHYMDQINLEDIAQMVHLNGVYFSVVFKKETGENFKEFLTQYRLNIAKEMLKNTENSISAVAELVGYKDTKYFSKLFAKNIGINPAQYRKLYNG